MDPFIGQIIMFGGNFAPRGWAFCNGQLLAISSNSALFSILGTTYGGDGRTTFGLPDLRGRSAMHAGNGPGLPSYRLGQKGGQESVTLTTLQIPSHTHAATLHGETAAATKANPTNNMLAGANTYAPPVAGDNKTLANDSIIVNNAGGGGAHNNMMPTITLNYIIALLGTYPSRN